MHELIKLFSFVFIIEYWFLGTIDKSTALVLANAVHFKCGWINEFQDAKDEPFYLTPDNQVTVKMMSLKKNLYYYHDDDLKFAALQLPYDVIFYELLFNSLKHMQLDFLCVYFFSE